MVSLHYIMVCGWSFRRLSFGQGSSVNNNISNKPISPFSLEDLSVEEHYDTSINRGNTQRFLKQS